MSKLEIEQMLVISTSHVMQETAERLPRGHSDLEYRDVEDRLVAEDDEHPWWPVFARPEGWLFYVGDDGERYLEAPSELVECVRFAAAQGCSWLMFDRDGPRIDQLRSWDW